MVNRKSHFLELRIANISSLGLCFGCHNLLHAWIQSQFDFFILFVFKVVFLCITYIVFLINVASSFHGAYVCKKNNYFNF